jgi:hypothetical protein
MANKKSILDRALAQLNKTDAQIQKEVLTDRLEDFRQSCTEDISYFKVSTIPRALTRISKAERALANAIKNKEAGYLSFVRIASFSDYTAQLFDLSRAVEEAKETLIAFENQLSDDKAQLAAAEDLLTILK